ncbi:MAG: carbohydrate porin [Sedimentisphaerales bacterium]|nr:carbohydrate porin [Sedimentisphaerales bacterium]
MHTTSIIIFLLCVSAAVMGHTEANSVQCEGICERESLTNGFFGLNEALENNGLEIALSATQVYQQNARGGLSTRNKAGRYEGSYDLELNADMQKLLGIEGGSMYMLTEGSWSNGINDNSVGSIFGVNGDAAGNEPIDVTQLWYQQWFAEETFAIRFGKIDMTGGFECSGCPVSFDGNRFANDETAQFLNSALVNNPTIPFPDEGLGVVLHWNPIDWWYASFGIADAQANRNTTGFNTAFQDEDDYISMFETGITPQFDSANGPLQGAYRVGVWYDPQVKERFSDETVKRDDTGFYLSLDQTLMKENRDDNDAQGLGVFARYGYADKSVNEITQFVSSGVQYRGLFEGRENDVLAAGVGCGTISDDSDPSAEAETVYEAYYKVQITKWFHLTPDIQYINNPGGDGNSSDALVVGLRAQMSF